MVRGKNSVPDRWHDYQPIQKCIMGTRFVPIKVPLREGICANMDKEQRFMPDDLLEILADKKLTLGLIIDLTNTTRYYNPEEFTDRGVEYAKIFTEGQTVPSIDVCRRFSKVVKNFEEDNMNKDSVIAVHCTHGVNRSGYLICRYMIENLSFSPDDAIKGFKEARGHGIERQPYIESLRDLNSTSRVDTSADMNERACYESRKQKSPMNEGVCYESWRRKSPMNEGVCYESQRRKSPMNEGVCYESRRRKSPMNEGVCYESRRRKSEMNEGVCYESRRRKSPMNEGVCYESRKRKSPFNYEPAPKRHGTDRYDQPVHSYSARSQSRYHSFDEYHESHTMYDSYPSSYFRYHSYSRNDDCRQNYEHRDYKNNSRSYSNHASDDQDCTALFRFHKYEDKVEHRTRPDDRYIWRRSERQKSYDHRSQNNYY